MSRSLKSVHQFMFGGNREKAIQRDGERCVSCGMTRTEHRAEFGEDITVDHIDGRGRYSPKEEKNNDLSNLQTLCRRCHARKDNKVNKLTPTQAVNIYHVRDVRGASMKLCRAYGVAVGNAWAIRNGKSWREVTGLTRR